MSIINTVLKGLQIAGIVNKKYRAVEEAPATEYPAGIKGALQKLGAGVARLKDNILDAAANGYNEEELRLLKNKTEAMNIQLQRLEYDLIALRKAQQSTKAIAVAALVCVLLVMAVVVWILSCPKIGLRIL